MSNDNPYASPFSDANNPFASPMSATAGFTHGMVGEGLWRKGDLLVMDKFAPLPDRCVKSNQPALGGRLKRKLSWHHPALFFLILISWVVYVIVALIVRKQATIEIGLSEAWFAKRRQAMLIGWGAALAELAMIVIGISQVVNGGGDAAPVLILCGHGFFLFGLIYGIVRSSMVSAKRIDDRYVWLKGVHPEFLAPLPDWPHNP